MDWYVIHYRIVSCTSHIENSSFVTSYKTGNYRYRRHMNELAISLCDLKVSGVGRGPRRPRPPIVRARNILARICFFSHRKLAN